MELTLLYFPRESGLSLPFTGSKSGYPGNLERERGGIIDWSLRVRECLQMI